ncbi:MAG: hypothetical protein ISS23_00050 [Nanoarchaeota archaeon]|nr:hypothetical protein [Nanoarchaeota archaeon]
MQTEGMIDKTKKIKGKLTLEDILTELNIKTNPNKITELFSIPSHIDLNKFQKIFRHLKTKLGYVGVKRDIQQVKLLVKLANSYDEILAAIDALAESNYLIGQGVTSRILSDRDVSIIERLAKSNLKRYSTISKILIDKLDYDNVNSQEQFYKILKICELDGDVIDAVNTLAKSNYYLNIDYGERSIADADINLVTNLAKSNLENYLAIFNQLKDKLGYEGTKRNHSDVEMIIQLSRLDNDNVLSAINILANSKYSLTKNKLFSKDDISVIEQLAKSNLKRFSTISQTLINKLNYDGIKTPEQFYKLSKLCKLDGDVIGAVNTLAESNYYLNISYGEKSINDSDVNLITNLAKTNLENYLNIFNQLKDKLGYEGTKGSLSQVEMIIQLSKLDNDNVLSAIKTLADSNYYLHNDGKRFLSENNVSTIERITEVNPRRYLAIFKKLNTKLGYEGVGSHYSEINRIIEISNLKGDILSAIDVLEEENYCNRELSTISSDNIKKISEVAIKLENEDIFLKKELENLKGNHICLYRGSSEAFIEFYSKIGAIEEKKDIIRAILNCDYENKDAVSWLDANEADLLREVGLE